jgi:dihydrolipoamide dehydrogenase
MVMGSLKQETEVAVLGAGPGGYVAALHAADLGLEVTLIDERKRSGGVCLLEGCIPSKTLIHLTELAQELRGAEKMGLKVQGLKIDPVALRKWKETVIDTLSKGIDQLCKSREIEVIRGRGRFQDSHTLNVEGASPVAFKHAIVATGSRPIPLPSAVKIPVWTSTEALELPDIPKKLLVVGGGYIGLELGFVYAGLGSQVTVVEFLPQIMTGADPDLVGPVLKNATKRFEEDPESRSLVTERLADHVSPDVLNISQ